MNPRELLSIPIDELDASAKLGLMTILAESMPNRSFRVGNEFCAMVLSADGVQPEKMADIRERNYCTFQIAGLCIVNTVREVEDISIAEKSGPNKRSRKTTHVKRFIESPPSAWSIHDMYLGNRGILPNFSASPGVPASIFSFKCPLAHKIVEAGVDVALRVSHRLTTSADFRALLFGVPKK